MEIIQQRIVPVINPLVRELCVRPYANHPKGCPNYGKKASCPPTTPLWDDLCDISLVTRVFWKRFNLAEQRERMKKSHPTWSKRQCECCLYWQQGARKPLKEYIAKWRTPGFFTTMCPEAMGINVTETMRQIGIELEWPPVTWTYQVAMGGWLI